MGPSEDACGVDQAVVNPNTLATGMAQRYLQQDFQRVGSRRPEVRYFCGLRRLLPKEVTPPRTRVRRQSGRRRDFSGNGGNDHVAPMPRDANQDLAKAARMPIPIAGAPKSTAPFRCGAHAFGGRLAFCCYTQEQPQEFEIGLQVH